MGQIYPDAGSNNYLAPVEVKGITEYTEVYYQ
jgi:hypothetical protein